MFTHVKNYLRELWQTTTTGWNRFWFTQTTPETLALIRVLAGSMLVYTHSVWAVDLSGFFGTGGRLPQEFVTRMHGSTFAWSFLYGVESPAVLWTIHIIALVVLLMFTVGFMTRITSILTFLITVSYAHRGAGALFGLDQINGLLALYLAVGPSGSLYSIDAWLRRRRGQPVGSPTVSANIAIRLMQLHMCVIYVFAGLGKLLGTSWWDGTALWGAFANFEYQTFDMTWMSAYPRSVNFITQFILAWEISYVVLIWPRLTRPIMLVLAIPLHLGIAVCMGMITFGLVMLIGNMAFIAPEITRAFMSQCFRIVTGQGRAGEPRQDKPRVNQDLRRSKRPANQLRRRYRRTPA